MLRICAKKISLIPGATGKPTGILQIFLHNLDMFFSSAFFSYFVICPLCPTYLPCFVKTLLQTDKKMTNTVPFIAYISSYPCNDDNNNVFSELRTEKSTIFFYSYCIDDNPEQPSNYVLLNKEIKVSRLFIPTLNKR